MFLCILKLTKGQTQRQWCKRNIFQRGQSHFARFFPGVKYAFSQWKFSILVHPKQTSLISKSEKQKEKKEVLCSFSHFFPSIFHFPPSTLAIFLLFFSLFPFFFASIFPIGLQKKISEKCQGGILLPPPPPLHHWPNMKGWLAKHDGLLVGQT